MNSKKRPNWYKILLPKDLSNWAIACLAEYVNLEKYQKFRKVSVSCKNNGKTIFVRLLFESKLYFGGKIRGNDDQLVALPVSYLIEVNRGIVKGNDMNYNIGGKKKYNEIYPVWNEIIKATEDSRIMKEKHILYRYISNYTIPPVKLN